MLSFTRNDMKLDQINGKVNVKPTTDNRETLTMRCIPLRVQWIETNHQTPVINIFQKNLFRFSCICCRIANWYKTWEYCLMYKDTFSLHVVSVVLLSLLLFPNDNQRPGMKTTTIAKCTPNAMFRLKSIRKWQSWYYIAAHLSEYRSYSTCQNQR